MEQISLLHFLETWKILLKYKLSTDWKKIQLMFAFLANVALSDTPGLRSFNVRVRKCHLHTTWD